MKDIIKQAVRFQTIDEAHEGQRLDNFLMSALKDVPKSHIYRLIRSGQVRVNQGRAEALTKLQLGDVVRIPPVRTGFEDAKKGVLTATATQTGNPVSPSSRFAHQEQLALARQISILFEDDHLLAIAKPAGLAVHGGSGISLGVIELLRLIRPDARFLELVHRLDRGTSGVLLIAKRRSALTNLQAQFRGRSTGKVYLALVLGDWPPKLKVLDAPLHKFTVNNGTAEGERRVKVVAKDDPNGMKAVSLVQLQACKLLPQALPASVLVMQNQKHQVPVTQASLLQVTIKTGRTHQIRVHLAHAGHPIAGDDKYGDFVHHKLLAQMGLKRMFLHAWKLSVMHPLTGQMLQINCPLSVDLQEFWQQLLPVPV